MNDNLSALLISILSLIFTLWALIRGRRNREIDMLYQCYVRLQKADQGRPFATISDLVEMEDNPDDPKWEEFKQKSDDVQGDVERELEFACYLVLSKQVNLNMFFYLFRGWLAGREMFWRGEYFHSRAKGHPYTVLMIETCLKNGLLPVKTNKKLLELDNVVERFIRKGK